MGGLTSAVHWWEESQMRVLVLGSLLIQFLLFVFSFLRRRALPGWFRSMMWLAYLASDAVAIYALATLFNRHKDQGHGDSSTLEVVWAPVLLVHLGGHDGITAYNIEDNELWSRHLLTAVSQATVAIYVFCKSWPGGDRRLLQAAIVLFVPGVLKCFMKPWALKRASINSLVSSAPDENETKVCTLDLEEYVSQAKDFVQHEVKIETRDKADQSSQRRWRESMMRNEAYKLFVDLSSPYTYRLSILKHLCMLSEEEAYGSVRQGLSMAFLLLYTRMKTTGDMEEDEGDDSDRERFYNLLQAICRQWVQASRMILPWVAIGLFHHSHKQAYNDTDVKITYAIFCCTAVLEISSSLPITLADVRGYSPGAIDEEQWPEMVAQYSLVGYFARNRKHSWWMWIVSLFGCKDFLDQHWCMRPCFSSGRITKLVLRHLKEGWMQDETKDAASYRSFNDSRGHRALEGKEALLGLSIKRPFDESVLLWHIVTEFCFFSSSKEISEHRCDFAEVPSIISMWKEYLRGSRERNGLESEGDTSSAQSGTQCGKLTACRAVQCRQMSNYMMYLLFVNPEMLLPGTRRNLFIAAKDKLEDDILNESMFETKYKELSGKKHNPQCWSQWRPTPEKQEWLMGRAISTIQLNMTKETSTEEGSEEETKEGSEEESNGGPKETLISDASFLARKLLKPEDDEKMWEVIEGVWVEMLCFSASRCRGYLHAKALSSGGEFLSYVWLLLFYMGTETLTERLQREELPGRKKNNDVTTPSSTSCTCSAPSTSKAHTGAFPSTLEIHSAEEDMV